MNVPIVFTGPRGAALIRALGHRLPISRAVEHFAVFVGFFQTALPFGDLLVRDTRLPFGLGHQKRRSARLVVRFAVTAFVWRDGLAPPPHELGLIFEFLLDRRLKRGPVLHRLREVDHGVGLGVAALGLFRLEGRDLGPLPATLKRTRKEIAAIKTVEELVERRNKQLTIAQYLGMSKKERAKCNEHAVDTVFCEIKMGSRFEAMEKPEGRPKKLGDVAEFPNYQRELEANDIDRTATYRWRTMSLCPSRVTLTRSKQWRPQPREIRFTL